MMNEDFIKVLEELLNHGMSVDLNVYGPDKIITGEIEIGSKCGKGKLYWDGEDVILETRYSKKDIIDMDNIIRDIAYIAWSWYLNYKDSGYNPSDTWLPIWKEMDLISEKIVSKTEYTIH